MLNYPLPLTKNYGSLAEIIDARSPLDNSKRSNHVAAYLASIRGNTIYFLLYSKAFKPR